MARIVTAKPPRRTRPPRKRRAVALKTAVVPAGKPGEFRVKSRETPAISTSISRKAARLARSAQKSLGTDPEPDDPEADAAMRAWLERAKWGRWPGEPHE